MTQLRAVVFDWAGTVIDHGSLAPVGAFQRAFATFGVTLTADEVRGPMGMAKRDHIRALLSLPRIAAAWTRAQGAPPDDSAVDRLHDIFVPMTEEAAEESAVLIDGVAPVIAALRARGLKIGSTTGYTRSIMARVLPRAAAQGFTPDCLVCAGDTPEGRPSPLMMYRAFLDLGVWPAHAVVKVDDTPVGIAEGRNAGCWTVGVALSGNAFGLSREETAALPHAEFAARKAAAEAELTRAGAHHVIGSAADLQPVIDAIGGRLARGERP